MAVMMSFAFGVIIIFPFLTLHNNYTKSFALSQQLSQFLLI